MHVFKDAKGREWNLSLGISAIRRVKALLPSVDLTMPQTPDATHGTLSQRLAVDVWVLVDVLYALFRNDCDAEQISEDDFAERLGGEALGKARDALFNAWEEFFRNLGRFDLVEALKSTREMTADVGKEAVHQMGVLQPMLLEQVKEVMQERGRDALTSAMNKIRAGSGQ